MVKKRLSGLYHKTFGRFIMCASLYRLNLEEYVVREIEIDYEIYSFELLENFDGRMVAHYEERPGHSNIAKARLDSGDYLCFAYVDKGKNNIAYTRWICKKHFYSDVLKMELIFKENELLTLDSYTPPDYRGRGLHKAMNIEMLNWIKSDGEYEYVYMVIKCLVFYLSKIANMLGYKRITTKLYYKKGSIKMFLNQMIEKIRRYGAQCQD